MICHTARVLPSLPGHAWRYSTADDLRHQYPADVLPDGEGVITAACDRLAFADRTRPPDSAAEAHCPDCLIHTMADAADRIEQAATDGVRLQQDHLKRGTFDL